MTAVMFDSIDANALPASGFDAMAGYVNGKWQSAVPLLQRFPQKPLLTITVFASGNARCADVESGDLTVAEAPGWLDRQYQLGQKLPVLYTSASQMQALIDACGNRPFLRWSAHYSATLGAHICGTGGCTYPLADATQWTDHGPNGENVDQTLMSDHFFQAIGGTVARTLTDDDVKAVVDALFARRFNKVTNPTDTISLADLVVWSEPVAIRETGRVLDALKALPAPPAVADILAGIKGLVFKGA